MRSGVAGSLARTFNLRSEPLRNGYIEDLELHVAAMQSGALTLQTSMDGDDEDEAVQECLDDLSQAITNYVQASNAIKKMLVACL